MIVLYVIYSFNSIFKMNIIENIHFVHINKYLSLRSFVPGKTKMRYLINQEFLKIGSLVIRNNK